MTDRTPEQIRDSIEVKRGEFQVSLRRLQGEVKELLDWRAHVARHRSDIAKGAAALAGLAALAAKLRKGHEDDED